MAEAELSVVIRLRDLLTQELKRLDGVLAQFQSGAAGNFSAAARAADGAAAALERVGAEAGVSAGQVGQVGTAAQASAAAATQAAAGAVQAQTQVGAAATTASAAVVAGSQAAQAATQGATAAQAQLGASSAAAGAQAATGAAQAAQASGQLGVAAQAAGGALTVEARAARDAAAATQAYVAATTTSAEASARLTGAVEVLTAEVAQLNARAGSGGLRALGTDARVTAGAFDGLGRSVRTALLPLLPFLTAAGAGFAALRSVQGASEFSRSIAEIASISEGGAEEVAGLRKEVLALSREFGQSPVDQARGLYFAISSGAESAAEGVDILRNSTRLAIAGLASTEDTVDLVTSALNAYRSQNLGAADAADTLFKTVEVGKGRVEDLARNYGKALPLGAALGISFRELSATMATLSLTQGSVEQSATALRSVLSGLLQVTAEQRAQLQGLGVAVDPASIKANGLVKTLVSLGNALNRDTDAIRAIFPDVRSLSGVLALVNDGGTNLNRVLDRFSSSAGSVGRALDKQLADPARQLSIILNSVRVSFNEAFGQEFLRQTAEATGRMGGITSASDLVANAAASVGRAFAAALPLVIRVSESAIKSVTEISSALDRVLPSARQFGIILVSSFEAVTVSARSALNLFDLLFSSISAFKNFTLFSNFTQKDLDEISSGLSGVEVAIQQIQKSGKLTSEQISALKESLRGVENVPPIRPTIDLSALKDLDRQLKNQKAEVEVIVSGEADFGPVKQKLAAAVKDFNASMQREKDVLSEVFRRVAESFVIPPDSIPEQPPIEIPIEIRRGEAEAQLAGLERQIAALQKRAFIVVQADGSAPVRLSAELAQLGEAAQSVQSRIDEVNLRVRALRGEAAEKIELEIKAKTDELAKFESGLADARSQAQLLGVDANAASRVLGASFNATRVQTLREEIAALSSQLRVLSGETFVISPDLDFDPGEIFSNFQTALSRALDRVNFSKLEQVARDSLRRGLVEGAGRTEVVDDIIDQFRGGVEPSLERQLALIDKQVQRQRDATDQMRELGIVSAYVADQFDAATNALEASKKSLSDSVAEARLLSEIRASELGIDVRFLADPAQLDKLIDETQRRLDAERSAKRFGIDIVPNFDETAVAREIAAAQRSIEAQFDEIRRSELVREGLRFGISLKDGNLEQLDADIAAARDSAQAYLDGLGDTDLRTEALRIGIEVDGVPSSEIEKKISEAQAKASEFSKKHPIIADLTISGIDEGARAFAGIATGAKTAREAVSDFFASMAEQAAFAIAKLAIVKSLIAAFGAESSVGNFLAVTFGAAKGVAIPAGGVTSFALGGVPNRASEEVRRFGTVVHEGLPERAAAIRSYGVGGVPHNSIVRSRQFAPLAEFGEAGPEAIVPLDSGNGVRGLSPGGTVSLPLARDSQGRLSVDLGGVLARAVTAAAKLAYGGAPDDLERLLTTREVPFAAGASAADIERSLRTRVEPFALGGIPADLTRTIGTRVEPFALGAAPADYMRRVTDARSFEFGGVPASSDPFTSRVAPAPAATRGSDVQRRGARIEIRPNITINVSSLEGQTAAAVILREKETIVSAVSAEIARSPLFRSIVRGDRA